MSEVPTASTSSVTDSRQPQHATQQERRRIWIATGYGISALALLGAMFYAVAQYVAR